MFYNFQICLKELDNGVGVGGRRPGLLFRAPGFKLNEPWLQETTQSSKPQGFYRFERQKEKLNPFPGAKKIGLEKLKLGAYYREQGTQNSKGGISFYSTSIPNTLAMCF